MDKKILFILLLLTICASVLVLGCTSTTPSPTATPSQGPTATSSPTSTTSQGVNSTQIPGVTVTPVPSQGAVNSSFNVSNLNDSIVNISGEPDESLPENNIPTPDAG